MIQYIYITSTKQIMQIKCLETSIFIDHYFILFNDSQLAKMKKYIPYMSICAFVLKRSNHTLKITIFVKM